MAASVCKMAVSQPSAQNGIKVWFGIVGGSRSGQTVSGKMTSGQIASGQFKVVKLQAVKFQEVKSIWGGSWTCT
jgi:hypothetical protein